MCPTHRPVPRASRHAGLRPQHLAGLQLIAALCGGELAGGEVGSSCITLAPGRLVCSHHLADTRTAGSCTLLAQSALPCLLFSADGATGGPAAAGEDRNVSSGSTSPELQAAVQAGTSSELDLRGGTDAAMAPPASYLQHVLLPVLRARLGVRAEMRLERRGFFPKGQGRVLLAVQRLAPGACLPVIDLTERGEVTGIVIRAFTAGRVVPAVGERLAAAAQKGTLPVLLPVGWAWLASHRRPSQLLRARTCAYPPPCSTRLPAPCRGHSAHAAVRHRPLQLHHHARGGARAARTRLWRRLRRAGYRAEQPRLRVGRIRPGRARHACRRHWPGVRGSVCSGQQGALGPEPAAARLPGRRGSPG